MAEEFQSYVLFDKFPRINSSGLKDFILSLEPNAGENCQISEFLMTAGEDGAECRGVISYGRLNVSVFVYAHPMPEPIVRATIGMANLADSEREKLLKHRVYARCTCLGSDEFMPVDSMIMLLKVGMAMCAQGGMAMANDQNATCFPAKMLLAYAHHARSGAQTVGFGDYEPAGPEEEPGLWEGLRDEGEPGQLLTGFLPVEVDHQLWYVSAGHWLFGLPELACLAGYDQDIDEIEEHFRTIFSYLFQHGPVIKVGETIRSNSMEPFSFDALPSDRQDLDAPCGTLVVKIQSPEGGRTEGLEE